MVKFARVLVLLVILLLPIYYVKFNFVGVPTNLIELMILASFVLALVAKRRDFNWPLLGPIALILLGMGLGTLIAIDPTKALGIFKGWIVVPILFYWASSNLISSSDRPKVGRLLTVNLLAVSLIAIGQYLGWLPSLNNRLAELDQYVSQGRAFGFFESPNLLAMYLAPLTILLSLWHQPQVQKPRDNFLTAAAIVFAVIALFLSGSRGGTLAVVLSASLWLFRTKLGPSVISAFLGLLVLIFGVLSLQASVTGSDATRLLIWQQAMEQLTEHPIFGIGPGQFQQNLAGPITHEPNYLTEIYPYALHPHNVFLNFYLSGGLLAIFGFLWILVLVARRFWRESKNLNRLAPTAAIVAILVHGLVDSTFFKNDLAVIFWLMVFLLFLPTEDRE